MAQQLFVKIELENGKQITHCTSLRIEQNLFKHHEFELVVPFEVLEKEDEHFFNRSHEELCGKAISISFVSVYDYDSDSSEKFDFVFKGLITSIALKCQGDLSNVFVLKGYSPTIILEDSALKRTFLKKNLKEIFSNVLESYAGNLLKRKLNPRSSEKIKYTVQYNETNFQFLNRLAAEYGEWFYYNGQELKLGHESSAPVNFFIDGIQSFDMCISLSPSKFKLSGYDYSTDKEFLVDASSKTVSGLNQFGKFALNQSEGVFNQPAILVAEKPIYSQSDLDELVKLKKSVAASKLIIFNGVGERPEISPGTVIEVKGTSPSKGGRSSQVSFGKYLVTEVTHTIDGASNYSNSFRAVPDSVQYPPPNPYSKHPVGETELAKVIDNSDPDGLGRVKVSFLWPGDQTESDWIRVGSFYSGGSDGKGMFFVPEVAAQVLVDYELNRPEYPFVITSVYPKKSGSRGAKGKNDEKVIYTQAGNQLVLGDKAGDNKIEITNANKSDTVVSLEFKGNGVISIKTNGKIEMSANETISIHAKDKISLEAKEIEFKATTKLAAESSSELNLKGLNVKINADATAEIKSNASMKVSSTMTEINGDGMTVVKGTMVKIN